MKFALKTVILAFISTWPLQALADHHEGANETLLAALADPSRSEADRARDATRRPADVIAFLGIGDGMTVVDLLAAGGWYTEVLSLAVGAEGAVYAQNTEGMLLFRDGANDVAMTQRLAGDRLPNVSRLDREFDDLGLEAGSVEAAITALNFHDIHNGDPEAAIGFLAAVRGVLKPGGTLGIIDHAGNVGADNAAMHRVPEEETVAAAVAAGFEVVGSSDALHNAEDDRTLPVFDPAVRGRTDRFLLRLRNPG